MLFCQKQIYDGCQSWETAFIVQAFCSTDLANEFSPTLERAHDFIKKSQVIQNGTSSEQIEMPFLFLCFKVLENHMNYESYYRHKSKGSWTLSAADNGWSVSDCTAEALKVSFSL